LNVHAPFSWLRFGGDCHHRADDSKFAQRRVRDALNVVLVQTRLVECLVKG
jgi:hypothetical protein